MTTTGHQPLAREILQPLIDVLLGESGRVGFRFWDGSEIIPEDALVTIDMTSSDALRRILWMPNELGFGRAYVAGDLDLDGSIYDVVTALRDAKPQSAATAAKAVPTAIDAALRLGVLRSPLPAPSEEARLSGWRHSVNRDSLAISDHYDVSNEFYRLVLGPSMAYSCARYADGTPADGVTLVDAQAAKHELICRKLGLHERSGQRLLDVGCGWGSMAMHAAATHGAHVVGITTSRKQAGLARERAADAGLGDLVEIRVQDYRDLPGEHFDAISSVGMSEHVGHEQTPKYFEILRGVLDPQGRLLNHAISSAGGSHLGRNSFAGRYVVPDGELVDVGEIVLAMERAGFEVRDVESLREHYAITLREWVANLEANWDEAVEIVGLPRAKIWRLYMAGSAIGFETGGIAIHQVLGVVRTSTGSSGMAPTRRSWL